MTSFHRIQNDVASRNINQQNNLSIVSGNQRKESSYSFGKDPEKLHIDAAKRNERNYLGSDYSLEIDPEKVSDGYLKFVGNSFVDKKELPHDTKNKLKYHDSKIETKEQDISSSSKTNHSYAIINESPAEHRAIPRKQSNRCRIIQAVVIVVVLAILGVIAFFIVSNILSKEKCGNPPSVENGHVQKNNRSGEKMATIYCNPGYGMEKHQEITCDENGKWGPFEPCTLSGCGQFPSIPNGLVTGTDKTFNTSAKLICNNGFMVNNTVYFNCLSNGSWVSDTEAVCVPHLCGPYTLPDNVNVSEDLSHINMSVIVHCDEGFDFKKDSDKLIKCDNNTWTGTPECEIAGTLTMETTNSPVHIGEQFDISCRLRNSARWQTLLLSRTDLSNDSVPEILYSVTYNHASGTFEKRYSTRLFNKEVSTFDDGVLILLAFGKAQCNDTGVYRCAVLIGDISSPTDLKATEKEVKVTETGSSVTEIIASASHVQGDELDVLCKGLIGKDKYGNKLGEILVRIYLDENTNKDMNTVFESTRNVGCQVEETVKATFVITNDMHGAELQCIFRGDDGSRDKKSMFLNVTTTKIQISSPSRVNIGDSLNISTKFTYISGWKTIELRKNCSGTEIPIFSLRENETVSNLTSEGHIILIESDIDSTSASLEYYFTRVKCSDACWKGGNVSFISAVKIEDSWTKTYKSIEFKMNPSVPVLSLDQDKFYRGQEANLMCTGNIGIPELSMRITENRIVQRKPSYTSKIILMNETCENVETVTFTIVEVKDELNGQAYQCEIIIENGTKLLSNEIIANVSGPILYFTEESKTGIVGSSKTIQCILTDVTNVTYVVLSRYGSEEKLCEVDLKGNGTCENNEAFSIGVIMSEDMKIFTTTLRVRSVHCIDEGLYTCKAIGISTRKTSMIFKVTVSATDPVLRLPTTIVENQKSESEDRFSCTAHLGYPLDNRKLKILIQRIGSSSFEDYITSISEKGNCMENTSIEVQLHVFESDTNGSTVRCVIVDDNKFEIKSSIEKKIRIMENVCLYDTTGDFDPHPYNCTRFIRCVGNRLYDHQCASGSCSLADTNPICSSNDCAKCYK